MIVDLMRNDLGRVCATDRSPWTRLGSKRTRGSGIWSRPCPGACATTWATAHCSRHLPARIGHRGAEGPGHEGDRGAGGHPARALHGRGRDHQPARRARPQRRDPHLRDASGAGSGSAPEAGSSPTRILRWSSPRRLPRRPGRSPRSGADGDAVAPSRTRRLAWAVRPCATARVPIRPPECSRPSSSRRRSGLPARASRSARASLRTLYGTSARRPSAAARARGGCGRRRARRRACGSWPIPTARALTVSLPPRVMTSRRCTCSRSSCPEDWARTNGATAACSTRSPLTARRRFPAGRHRRRVLEAAYANVWIEKARRSSRRQRTDGSCPESPARHTRPGTGRSRGAVNSPA